MSDPSPLEPRVKNVEEAIQILTTLMINADERMEQHGAWINQLGDAHARVEDNQAQFDVNLNALTQIVSDLGRAQTRVEDNQARVEANLDALTQIVSDLGQAQARSEQRQAQFETNQAQFDANLAALTQIVSDLGRAQTRTEQAQARTEQALAKLAESQEHTDRLLDTLIDKGNDGRSE
ncbi:MAG TPA: hypothetical protein VGO69_06625 [Pyrinomonadaceae bacterium]|nr:hypothetical protein [Pyrinomonadaceae bacterium]